MSSDSRNNSPSVQYTNSDPTDASSLSPAVVLTNDSSTIPDEMCEDGEEQRIDEYTADVRVSVEGWKDDIESRVLRPDALEQ